MSASDNKSSGPSPAHIMQTGFAFWSSKVLLTAVELDVFTALAKGPSDLESLTQKLGLHARSSRDFFDTLVALGFLNRKDGLYSNTTDTEAFLDRNKPTVYIGGILQMLNNRLYHAWGNLTTALKTGLPQNEVKDKETDEMFSTLYSDFDKAKEFLSAMTGVSKAANIAIAKTNTNTFDWSKYKTYVDVGTAQGDLAVQVAVAHPHLTGLGFDLPAVQPHFDAYVAENKVQDRLKFSAGEFFKDGFPKCDVDVVMMGHILHDWDLPTKKMLIKKAYEALPAGGAFIVFESLIDDDRSKNAFGLLMSLNMLIETPGGFDYSGADCTGWLKEAGFSTVSVHHLVGPDSMVVALK